MRDDGGVEFEEFDEFEEDTDELIAWNHWIPPWEPIEDDLLRLGAVPLSEARLVRVTNTERDCMKFVIVRVTPSGVKNWRKPCGLIFCKTCANHETAEWTKHVDFLLFDVEVVHAYIIDPDSWGSVRKALYRSAAGTGARRVRVRFGAVDLLLSNVPVPPGTKGVLGVHELESGYVSSTFRHVVESLHLDGRYLNDPTKARPIIATPGRSRSKGERSIRFHRLTGDQAERFEEAYDDLLANERRADPTLPEDHRVLVRDHLVVVERCADEALDRSGQIDWS